MNTILRLKCDTEFAALNFEAGSYKDAQNQERGKRKAPNTS